MKTQLHNQEEVLKKLLEQAQAQQMKEMEALFERENKEMKTGQARASVETAREIQNDKSLKSKAEKDRRLREKHSNNTKVIYRTVNALRLYVQNDRIKRI